jgi:phage terminase large subunit
LPDSQGSIIGEIGDKIGRGGRTGIYFVDEAAHLEHDLIVDAALSKNTPCRQDISSVCGMTNSFAARMHDGVSRKFTYHWRDNPRFTEEDYAAFRKQWGPVITAQELDIDYLASVEGVIIPQVHVQAMIDAHRKLKIEPSGVRRGALDVADEGKDKCAFAGRHGPLVIHCESWRGKGSFMHETTDRAYLLCDTLQLEGFDYDADGMGAGVRSDVDRIEKRRKAERLKKLRVLAYRGSGEVFQPEHKVQGTDRTAKDMYQNLKAQSWGELARRAAETARAVLEGGPYDPDLIISLDPKIPELRQLCIELSQAQWKISANGKLMVDKTPDGSASPNMADSLVMLFSPRPRPMNISDAALEAFDDPENW